MTAINKTAVITGASRGIGEAVALKFAKKGYNTAICCHSNSYMLENVRDKIISTGMKCISYTGDMSDSSCVEDFFSYIYKYYNSVDVLVNNAGVSYVGLLSDMSDEDWNRVINTNLNSVFYCCRKNR